MCLYARQLGWYNSTPEGEKESRAQKFKTQHEGLELDLPVCRAEYLVPLFVEAGMFVSTGSGIVPLSWSNIKDWMECTERNLSLWEKKVLREMSKHYVYEYYEATKKDRDAPYQSEMTEELLLAKRKAVASAWKAQKEALKIK